MIRYTITDIDWVKNEDNSYKLSRKLTKQELADEAEYGEAGPIFSFYELEIGEQKNDAATRAALAKALNKFTGYTSNNFEYSLGWE